ncbi:putative serine/threonine-protein kinase fhkC [Diplonema papillatum]|nr:putative serine/threonine-protein kinase fhkC [Diplonema papillatum]|eukprot:gene23339-35751_t
MAGQQDDTGEGHWGELIPLHGEEKVEAVPHSFVVEKIVLDKNPFVIGRTSFGVSYWSNNPAVSTYHCTIRRSTAKSNEDGEDEAHQVELEDQSTNGVYVRGRKVGKGRKAVLCDGDEVLLVKTVGDDPSLCKFNMSYVFRDMSTRSGEERALMRNITTFYFVDEVIGKGGHAEVRKGVHRRSGDPVAIKIINRKKIAMVSEAANRMEPATDDPMAQYREIRILKRVSHPCISRILDVFLTGEAMQIVMELALGGDLFDLIKKRKRLSEGDARLVLQQIAEAVAYLHKEGIAHRDIKLENILLARADDVRSVKLADFGLAKAFETPAGTDLLKTTCGTPMYTAPEIIERKGAYTEAVDIWSLGVVLFAMLVARPPFPQKQQRNGASPVFDYARPLNFAAPPLPKLSPALPDLLANMMHVDPTKRMTIQQVLDHPWLHESEASNNDAEAGPEKDEPKAKRVKTA